MTRNPHRQREQIVEHSVAFGEGNTVLSQIGRIFRRIKGTRHTGIICTAYVYGKPPTCRCRGLTVEVTGALTDWSQRSSDRFRELDHGRQQCPWPWGDGQDDAGGGGGGGGYGGGGGGAGNIDGGSTTDCITGGGGGEASLAVASTAICSAAPKSKPANPNGSQGYAGLSSISAGTSCRIREPHEDAASCSAE